ncbi:GNAT family N-acetyltransferase [Alteromonas facilis]|uniref:GNAT family N-acetyltransferase n=1 Tax=Alteromonas facilis TaxID=2048004 RepID=UPI000C2814DE|nr:GNAT family N-acetyltransferase [Alteromonas facilis]
MKIAVIESITALAGWNSEWDRIFLSCSNSVFISYEWVAFHLNREQTGFILVIHDGERLQAAVPLRKRLLSHKQGLRFPTLEHLCQAHTDFHEILIDKDVKLQSIASKLAEFLQQNFKHHLIKLDLPPQKSSTELLLNLLSVDYDVANSGVQYVFEHHRKEPNFDKKLLSDIRRRDKKLAQEHTVNFSMQETMSDDVINEILDLHKKYHGESSLNSCASRPIILAMFNSLSDKVVCSTLRVDGTLAACAISFIQGQQLQYFAPAINTDFRSKGVGLILLSKVQSGLQQLNLNTLSFLRGEEGYKIRVASCASAISPVLAIPHSYGRFSRTLIRKWLARKNNDLQAKRLRLSQSVRRDLSGGKAIVLANGLNGLGVVRALTAAGIDVVAICPSQNDLSAHSNQPVEIHTVMDSDSWESEVLAIIHQVSRSCTFTIPIFTCSDKAANFVEHRYNDFPTNVRAIFPEGNLTHILNDKQMELSLVYQAKVPIPNSVWEINGSRPFDALKLPIIIKPKDFNGYKVLKAKNLIVIKINELDTFYKKYANELDQFVAQELIEGEDENLWVCNATFDENHNMICAFTFRRMGTSPSHFGVTSLALSEHNQELKDLVKLLGKEMQYRGPGMWEFKYCKKHQQYLYIETNPRLGMCNWFDSRCNVNNVLATYELALGKKVNPLVWQQSTGIYFVNAMGDFMARLEDKEPSYSIFARMGRILPGPIVWSTWHAKDKGPTFFIIKLQLKMFLFRVIKKLNLFKR